MKQLEIGDTIYEWTDYNLIILANPYYKISLSEKSRIVEVLSSSSKKGILILGDVKAVIDSIVYTTSHGAVGNSSNFSGKNLVILGLSIDELKGSTEKATLDDAKIRNLREEASAMIQKLNMKIEDPCFSISLTSDDPNSDDDYVIFGRNNFLLVGSEKKFVLVHKKQISIRDGENKLVLVDPNSGITIAQKEKVLTIGDASFTNLGTALGSLGVNIASSVLNELLWD